MRLCVSVSSSVRERKRDIEGKEDRYRASEREDDDDDKGCATEAK